MKIVIIEDEKLIAKDLARTIGDISSMAEIVAFIETVEDGIAYFNEQPSIDLIFSDIQLGDGMSFEIFDQVKNQTPIIFCTAFNQYALEAFNTIGIDYLLKPITKQNTILLNPIFKALVHQIFPILRN
jgi:two-component system, LytTR family, response regulator LytT